MRRDGMMRVPLKLYFNDKGRAKMELALARGRKLHDKREAEKARDWGGSCVRRADAAASRWGTVI